jgi:uncharacterized protein YndB with AHSA1/START domain
MTEVNLKQTVAAPRYRVFRAWTDLAEIVQWWAPAECTDIRVEMDLNLNGALRYEAVMPDRRWCAAVGKFTEVDGPRKLTMEWRWEGSDLDGEGETTVTVLFHDRDGATEVELSHGGFSSEAAAEIEQGWAGSLSRLATHLGG